MYYFLHLGLLHSIQLSDFDHHLLSNKETLTFFMLPSTIEVPICIEIVNIFQESNSLLDKDFVWEENKKFLSPPIQIPRDFESADAIDLPLANSKVDHYCQG